MEKRFVYADNAATTAIIEPVKEAIIKALDIYGNPSSLYSLGGEAKEVVEKHIKGGNVVTEYTISNAKA